MLDLPLSKRKSTQRARRSGQIIIEFDLYVLWGGTLISKRRFLFNPRLGTKQKTPFAVPILINVRTVMTNLWIAGGAYECH